jgi:transcriptional regulator with XRE-family HTH domain
MSDENHRVARNVSRFRQELGLTLGEVARRSGLSKQTLSKIEQGVGNPTVDTLGALARALGTSTRRLLTEYGIPVLIQRSEDGLWKESAGKSERILDEVYGWGYVRTALLQLDRDAQAPEVAAHHIGALHHLYVISGRLRTGPVNDSVEVSTGDFVRFPADVPHHYVCLTDTAVAHVVTTLPQIRQIASRQMDALPAPGSD